VALQDDLLLRLNPLTVSNPQNATLQFPKSVTLEFGADDAFYH
jgi:hypothetical protein